MVRLYKFFHIVLHCLLDGVGWMYGSETVLTLQHLQRFIKILTVCYFFLGAVCHPF